MVKSGKTMEEAYRSDRWMEDAHGYGGCSRRSIDRVYMAAIPFCNGSECNNLHLRCLIPRPVDLPRTPPLCGQEMGVYRGGGQELKRCSKPPANAPCLPPLMPSQAHELEAVLQRWAFISLGGG